MWHQRGTARGRLVGIGIAVAAGSAFALTIPALAGDTPAPPDDRKPGHLEKPEHPYVAVPLEARPRSRAARVARGGFVSVQVNVDADGNNIVGDAANEPSIAIDPTNRDHIAIGWRQFDTIQSNFRQAGNGFSCDGGQTWNFNDVIDRGQFRSDPVLASDAVGVFYYYSLRDSFLCDMFISVDGGDTWGSPNFAWGGDKQWFTIDTTDSVGRGHLYGAWSTAGNPHAPNQFTWSTHGGTNWNAPITFPNPRPRWGTLVVDDNGDLYVCGWTNDQGYRVLKSTDAKLGGTPTWDFNRGVDLNGSVGVFREESPNPAGLLGQCWIDVDRSEGVNDGDLYMLSSVDPPGSDPLDVYFARSEDGGLTWSDPVRVNDDPVNGNKWQWFGTMSVAPNGRIDAVWNDTRGSNDSSISELYYSFSEDGGRTWAENIPLSPPFNSRIGWPRQNKLGDYYDMISDDDGASLAWAATFNDEQDVYYLRIAQSTCVGDIDGDGQVAFDDLLQLLSAWGPCAGCPEDLNGDDEVTFDDLLILLAAWGPCP